MTSFIPGRVRVTLLVEEDAGALSGLLNQDAPGTVYLRSMAHEFSVSPTEEPTHGRFYGAWKGSRLVAVAFAGNSHNLTTHGDAEPVEDLLKRVESAPIKPQLFVGPEEHAPYARRFFSRVGFSPRLDRKQYSYVLDRGGLEEMESISLHQAKISETEEIVAAHAAMIEEDLNISRHHMNMVRLEDIARRRIAEGKIWAHRDKDHLIFKTEEISRSEEAILVGGVYTRPSHRGFGYATKGMATWASIVFATPIERMALHVDAGNPAAIKAYERVGYTRRGNLRLILCT